MFPISDVIPSRTRPLVTIGLIAVNVLAFLYQLQLDQGPLHRLVVEYGVIPARFSFVDVATSLFLHADFLHLAGTMVVLWIFGDNVISVFWRSISRAERWPPRLRCQPTRCRSCP